MLQFLTAAEGHPFVRNHTLVEREPELRITCMQPGMLSIRDCKSAVVPKPHKNMLEEYFPVHNTSTVPLKLSYYTGIQTRKPSPGEKTNLNLMKSNKQYQLSRRE